jgi:hypothetical protein
MRIITIIFLIFLIKTVLTTLKEKYIRKIFYVWLVVLFLLMCVPGLYYREPFYLNSFLMILIFSSILAVIPTYIQKWIMEKGVSNNPENKIVDEK